MTAPESSTSRRLAALTEPEALVASSPSLVKARGVGARLRERCLATSFGAVFFTACAVAPVPRLVDGDDGRERCLPASVVEVVPRVDGGLVVVEAVVTQQVCRGTEPASPPLRLAEIRRRPELPTCPLGTLGAKRWPGGFSLEPPVKGLPSPERARLELAFTSFATDARAFVIGCPQGGALEWLFVETPRAGLPARVGFFDGDTLRFAPGHENVLFPAPPPTPVIPTEPPLARVEDEPLGPEEPEPVPPRVTATGCPAQPVDAQWVVRRFVSGASAPGERSMPGPETLERWSLSLDGGAATLVAETQQRPRNGAGAWVCRDASTVQGTSERRGPKLTLRFGSVVASCRQTTLPVEKASAKRHPKRLPQRLDEEGCDRYRWAASAPVTTKALVCTGELPLNALPVFAPAPGLERLVLANDCQAPAQRDALRLVPADGGVTPAF